MDKDKSGSYLLAFVITLGLGVGAFVIYQIEKAENRVSDPICEAITRKEPGIMARAEPEALRSGIIICIEGVDVVDEKTILRFAATPAPHIQKSAHIFQDEDRHSYLIDADGAKYALERDEGEYPLLSGSHYRELKPREVFRYKLVFPKLNNKSPYVYFEDGRGDADEMKISLKW